MAPTPAQLEAAHAWENGDYVPGRPAMTEFRRRVRYHQSRWRETHGHPIGTQPYAPRPGAHARLVGSRVPLVYGRETGANFLTGAALDAARRRTSFVEANQSFDHQRLWADLLSSEALAFNVFGELASDPALADRAVHTWWPDAPGRVADIRFAHSPGRLDPEYLNSLRAWDAAFILDLDDGTHGILAVDTEYHEWAKPEIPRPENLSTYLRVAERSGIFTPRATDRVHGRWALTVMWLEHLLLHSMLQHRSRRWSWGRYVVVYPAGNSDYAAATARYRGLLADGASFDAITLEAILDAGVLPTRTIAALRDRYLPG